MLGLSGPVRAAIVATLATLGGLSVYNISQRPTTQTIAGVSNSTLMAVAAAVVLVIYLRPKSKR
jgi:hypothetical protein